MNIFGYSEGFCTKWNFILVSYTEISFVSAIGLELNSGVNLIIIGISESKLIVGGDLKVWSNEVGLRLWFGW